VDAAQAQRVESLALLLGNQLLRDFPDNLEELLQVLSWAARLHEVGISVAHSGYHKHSAYILGNADMPGFSRREQDRLSVLALAHRGAAVKARDFVTEPLDFALIFSLRLAVVFHRSRGDINLPRLEVSLGDKAFELRIERAWLERNPLTDTALSSEIEQWTALGFDFKIDTQGENAEREVEKASKNSSRT
jgi:exopolyphosphatase / guanosine-5'-triphosphate,3'-diphosphate pyrophosphatase